MFWTVLLSSWIMELGWDANEDGTVEEKAVDLGWSLGEIEHLISWSQFWLD